MIVQRFEANRAGRDFVVGDVHGCFDQLEAWLDALAFDMTDSFCYGCYRVVKEDFCPQCGSDDFMRHLKGEADPNKVKELLENILNE